MKDTAIKVAEYGNIQKEKMARVTLVYFILGIVALISVKLRRNEKQYNY